MNRNIVIEKPKPNSPARATRVSSVINNDPALHKIVTTVKKIKLIKQTLAQVLPSTFKEKLVVKNLQNGVLVIGCPNASMATQLRLRSALLLEELRKTPLLTDLFSIQFKIHTSEKR